MIRLRIAIFLLFFCALAGRASASYTNLSSCQSTGTGGGANTCTLTVTPNTLLVSMGWFYGVGTDSVTDGFGLTWSDGGSSCNQNWGHTSDNVVNLFWVYTGSHSGSDTITATAAGDFSALVVVDYATGLTSGSDGSVCAFGSNGSAGSFSSGSITTTHANDLVIGFAATINGETGGVSAGSGYSFSISPDEITGGPFDGTWLPFEDMLGASSGSYSGEFTQLTNGGDWIAWVAAFPTATPSETPRHGTGFY